MKFTNKIALFVVVLIGISCVVQANANLADKWDPKNSKKNTLEDLYGKDDLGNFPLFKGGFINFGYWNGLPVTIGAITETDRVSSARAMYDHIATKLQIMPSSHVVEIGSGLGVGCAHVFLQFKPASITCIDASPAQMERAKQRNKALIETSATNISFVVAKAEKLPLKNGSVDKIFSIEAAHHFDSIEKFLAEAYRVLRPQGRVVITTFFAKQDPAAKALYEMLGTIKHGSDKALPISFVEKAFAKAGFKNARNYSIGAAVWNGYDAWIKQSGFKDTWNTNWLKSYEDGLLDYVVFVADKQGK